MIFPIHHLPDVIRVGVQTEQDVTVIGFDLKPWLDAFPDMKFTVWPTRPGEEEAYRANDQMMVGTVLYWHPDGYDTEIAGQGRVEIAGVDENQRKASGFVQTDIRATSLGKTKEPGESVAPWYESIIKAAEEIKDAHGDGGLFLVREVNHVADRTVAEIVEAADAGKTVLLVKTGGKVYMLNNVILDKPTFYAVQSGTLQNPQGYGIVVSEAWIDTDGTVKGSMPNVSKTPNPYALKLTGAVNATYDGSSLVTVEIPQGGSGESAPKEITILSETAFTQVDGDESTYYSETPFDTKPAGGMLCTVNYNGVEYKCVTVEFDSGSGTAVAMGNFALIGEEGGNPDAPFVMLCAPDGSDGMYAMMMVADSPASVTVGITAAVVDEATKAYVDSKVDKALAEIPEPEPGILTVTADMYNLEVTNPSHTYEEITEALNAGKAVQMIVRQNGGLTLIMPLLTWNEDGKVLTFQLILAAEETAAVTIRCHGNTGALTAEFRVLGIGGATPAAEDVFYTDDGQ